MKETFYIMVAGQMKNGVAPLSELFACEASTNIEIDNIYSKYYQILAHTIANQDVEYGIVQLMNFHGDTVLKNEVLHPIVEESIEES